MSICQPDFHFHSCVGSSKGSASNGSSVYGGPPPDEKLGGSVGSSFLENLNSHGLVTVGYLRWFSHVSTVTSLGGCHGRSPLCQSAGSRCSRWIAETPSCGVRSPPKSESLTRTVSVGRKSRFVGSSSRIVSTSR